MISAAKYFQSSHMVGMNKVKPNHAGQKDNATISKQCKTTNN